MYIIHINSTDRTVSKKENIDIELEKESGDQIIEVSEDLFNTISTGWRFVEGHWISPSEFAPDESDNPIIQRMNELKANLRGTDWIVVEILESHLVKKNPSHDIDKIYSKRQAWRDELKELKNKV